MKMKKYYLILAVVTGTLCTLALGGIELPFHKDEPSLTAQPNPALSGMEELFVVIDAPGVDPNKYGWIHQLDWKLIQRLQKTGFTMNPSMGGSVLNFSVLRVNLDLLNLSTSQQSVFRVQTSLSRTVSLLAKPEVICGADIWKSQPVMQAVSTQNMPAAVTDVVLEQVEAFIHAYLAANPKGAQPATDRDISAVPQRQIKSIAKPPVAKYNYVASKNSNVFHKPECSSAKRISPENLVGYNSRDEALKAGKRPCKQCKP